MSIRGSRSGAPRVLFLSGLQIHPTLSGGNLRSFALANALRHHGLDVFVFSLVGRKKDYLAGRPSGITTWPEGIEEHVDRGPLGFVAQFGSYALGLPPFWLTAYLRAGAGSPGERLLPRRLREELARCDVLLADFPFVHPIFQAPSGRGSLRVLSTHNLEHRLYAGRQSWRDRWVPSAVRRIELRAAESCDVLLGCCDDDRRYFEAGARVRRSILVPNGIDPRRFAGLEGTGRSVRQRLGIADHERIFLFTASKYGPNREAFEMLLAFARRNARLLMERKIHILVVGSVTRLPVREAGFTATGTVEAAEPYFAAADAALNPMRSGGGTNLKMCEFIAARLPILTTRFGARGFRLEDGESAFLFEREGLWPVLSTVRRLFDEDPARLRRMAENAYARNQGAIDMDACVEELVETIWDAGRRVRGVGQAGPVGACPRAEARWLP